MTDYTREQILNVDKHGNTLLHRSITNAESALDATVTDINKKSFYFSALKNFFKIYRSALKHLTKDEQVTYLNQKNSYGETALILACKGILKSIVKILLTNSDINPNLADNGKITPLMAICLSEPHRKLYASRQQIVANLLARSDINVNLVNAHGQTALAITFLETTDNKLQSSLLEQEGIHLIQDGENGKKSLFLACQTNYAEGVNAILTHYKNNHAQDKLLEICNARNEYFLPQVGEQLHLTPLQVASFYQNIDIVEELLTIEGIDVNAAWFDNSTTLHFACMSAFDVADGREQKNIALLQHALPIIELLVQHPNINKVQANYQGYTPFGILARAYTCQEILGQICELDCHHTLTWLMDNIKHSEEDLTVFNERQRQEELGLALTPLQIACVNGNANVVSRLLAIFDMDVNAPLPGSGLSTLALMFSEHLADVEETNIIHIIGLLLKDPRTDVNMLDASGHTALTYAISSNFVPLATMSKLISNSRTSINTQCYVILMGRQMLLTALDLCIEQAFFFKNVNNQERYEYYVQVAEILLRLGATRCQAMPELPVDLTHVGSSSLSLNDSLTMDLYPSSSTTSSAPFCQATTSFDSKEKFTYPFWSTSTESDSVAASSTSVGLSQSEEINQSKPTDALFLRTPF